MQKLVKHKTQIMSWVMNILTHCVTASLNDKSMFSAIN